MHRADAFVAIESEVVEGQRELAVVAFAGAARDHIGEHRGNAQAAWRIVNATCGNHEIERCRAHVIHAFGQ